jgi:hypothetical protein
VKGNSNTLSNGYQLWDGLPESDFTAVNFGSEADNGYTWSTNPNMESPAWVPPLQSFFVQKKSPTATLSWVMMSPQWTTTQGPKRPYVLRASAANTVDPDALRIKVSQGARTAYALLRYNPEAAPEYSSNEDMRAIFYNELPLTVYTRSTDNAPLLINVSGRFVPHDTPLGLRVANTGEVTLSFSGMESFGHEVYLMDYARNLKIRLRQEPEYTFTVANPSGSGMVEITDRFGLRMEYNGWGLVSVTSPDEPAVRCQGSDGCILVQALAGTLRRVEVYNVAGALAYSSGNMSSSEYRIASPAGVYFLKVQTDDGIIHTAKVFVN